MKKLSYILTTLAVCSSVSCFLDDDKDNGNQQPTLPAANTQNILPYKVLKTLPNGTEVRNGGYGSATVAHPTMTGHFYGLTDRGPNANHTGEAGKGKKFPVPEYTPRIGHFKVDDAGNVVLVEDILLKNPQGQNISGLPNPAGKGATGEVPYDNAGTQLSYDDYGIDGEGLVALSNGEFWVSDEYGPHIIHYNASGVELERISPVNVNTGTRKLPAVLERRRANRGMEGLTITKDGTTLVGIMQSTIYNPHKDSTTNTTLTRIVTFNLSTAATKQYLYKQEKAWNANSEITAISNTEFLVVERDGLFYGNDAAAQKHIYKIDITNATDVTGDFNSMDGYVSNGKTLEQLTWEEISAMGIKPVTKSLVIDLVATLPNHYPHDKLEGIWLIDQNTIGVVNDDDFSVTVDSTGVVQKYLPGTTEIDGSSLYILDVSY